MNDADLLKRITVNPGIFGGKPIIRGMRVAVEHIHTPGRVLPPSIRGINSPPATFASSNGYNIES